MKNRFKRFLFRIMRNTLVLHLRAEGLSWAMINRVLRATGQKIIVSSTQEDGGIVIHYENYDPAKGLKQKRRG